MDVILIAAVTANGMISHDTKEVVNWSRDLKLFREQTMGHTVIMGSNTAKTLSSDLEGRKRIVMHRELDPAGVISRVEDDKCFIIGGARTYSRFAPHLTHLFLTFHPLVMNSRSLPLFSHLDGDLELEFINTVKVDGALGIYQFQYKVKQ